MRSVVEISKNLTVLIIAGTVIALGGLTPCRGHGGGNHELSAGVEDYRISFWAAKCERNKKDYLSRTNLGHAYIDAARRSGDISLYLAAEASLNEALGLNPRYVPALAALAATHLARHGFSQALSLAEQAYELDSTSVEALAVLGDAQLELGNYDGAAITFRLLHRRLPGLAAEARLARLAFLRGRTEEAIERARTALEMAGSSPDQSYAIALTTYAFYSGDFKVAENTAEEALARAPASPAAIETLALVRTSQGHLRAAADLYERLLALGPNPAAHVALGDIFTKLNRPEDAEQHYLAVEPAARGTAVLLVPKGAVF